MWLAAHPLAVTGLGFSPEHLRCVRVPCPQCRRHLNPPEHALVFSVDEKTQTQALDRRQPGLPLKKGHCGTMTHDFRSVDELEAAIHEYLARHNAHPKPFIWKATHADILGKAARAKAAMLNQSVG